MNRCLSESSDRQLRQHVGAVSIVLFCFIVCYLLNIVLFYLKYDVCSKNVIYKLINMLKVFQSIGQYWNVKNIQLH